MTSKRDAKDTLIFFMNSILDNLPFDIWFRDKDGINLYVNKNMADSLGKTKEQLVGKSNYDEYNDKEAVQFKKTDLEALSGKHEGYTEFMLPDQGDRREYKKVVYDDDGEIAGLIGFSEDTTKETNMLKALKRSEMRFRAIFEEAPLGIGIFDAESGKAYQINQRYVDVTGRTKREVMSMKWQDYTYPDDIAENEECNRRIAAGEISTYSMEKRFVHPDGKIVWINITVAKYHQAQDSSRVLCMLEDITSRKKAEEKVTYLSYYDELTGIYNRRYYSEVLSVIDTEENLPVSIIMADVNGLKLTNDAFGHAAGDKLLKRTADIMKKVCRDSDIIARIGGDEFVVILPNTCKLDAERVVRRIQAETFYGADDELNVIHSVSFGWDAKTKTGMDIMQVYKQAEDEMYRHKLVEGTRMRRETIRMITKRMRQNNGFELEHSQQVKKYSVELGKEVGMSGTELLELKTAAFLHDIGKTGFDEALSQKAEKLSDEEWAMVVKHPETGYQILRASNEFNKIAEYVLHHHERIDGSGYPSGLTGARIPIQSKIISIAEAYAIMIAGTAYQDAMTKQEAIDELCRNAGTQFDSELVKLFVENVLMKEDDNDEENRHSKDYHRRWND